MTLNSNDLPDALDRQRAIETFDRNLVVTAGAGTGKTTLLVDRLVRLLLRSPEPLRITEMVALTFTNKAANEMKQRLRERLQNYLQVDLQKATINAAEEKAQQEVAALVRLNQLSKDELDTRVRDALRNLERAEIGTIHSFAATLLRLYPLEAGVDPQFQEDDGKQFDRIFEEQWDLWLDRELSLESDRAEAWREVLRQLRLEQIRSLANSLCSESVELAGGTEPDGTRGPAQVVRAWLERLLAGAAALSERHPGDRVNEKLVRSAAAVIKDYRNAGALSQTSLAEERGFLLAHSINKATQGWSENDADKAQDLVRAAKGLCHIDARLTALVWRLLVPYIERFRQAFIQEGFVSFDGLLIRARNLVRDHGRVRDELKRRFRTILIDEFQDTDPIQYEILLYLAEQPGNTAKDWRKIRLTPGKVFVVGDPKQSIYAFRRADIEAYLEVVEKIIKAQNGIECRLTANFRSDAAILDVVNGVFESLIQAQPGVQPSYIGIQPAPQRNLPSRRHGTLNTLPRVMVRKIVAPDEEVSAEKARRLEGESLACWLSDAVLDKMDVVDAQGESARVQPRDVAILFRKLTDIHDYLEPLRRRGIRYVVEGERHFYAAKEVMDAVNLLRAIENPHDRLALVGVLRSPLGALTDQDIYHLHCRNLLDYRLAEQLGAVNVSSTLAELYRTLTRLHHECQVLPVGEAVSHIFATVPLKLLAASYFHGEQAVANLEKLHQQAEALGRHSVSVTFKQVIRQLQKRVLEVGDEGESVLAEENVDAVRIMSIHKSKGLEFPIVILAGCHTGTDGRNSRVAEAMFDWSSGLTGVRIGTVMDLAGVYIAEKNRLRAEEEQKRVLYVAMTRAREHLVISSVPTDKVSSGNFVGMLDGPLGNKIAAATESAAIAIGPGTLHVEIVEANLTPPDRSKRRRQTVGETRDWQPYLGLWAKRRRSFAAAVNAPLFVTPTSLKRQEQALAEAAQPTDRRARKGTPRALLVGELAHRFLEQWDFGGTNETFGDRLAPFLAEWMPLESRKHAAAVRAELEEILEQFAMSDIYAELSQVRILGREMPLLMPWHDRIMEGVIDLVYERSGLLYLADYKTDTVTREELRGASERYRHQAEIYSRAARECLKREVTAFKLIFLRLGESVDVDLSLNKELWLF
jgi:ATP-dependent helicase/nuclease subunit A